MAKAYSLYVGMVTALALCKYSLAEWNTTEQLVNNTVSLHHQGNTNNFKDSIETATQAKKSGHFTKCPKELRQYCIHGSCRFVKEQNTPSCRCERGYIGSRCEYVDLASRLGDKRQIIVACVIAVLVFLILLITFICICAHDGDYKCYSPAGRDEGLGCKCLLGRERECSNSTVDVYSSAASHCQPQSTVWTVLCRNVGEHKKDWTSSFGTHTTFMVTM
uniref:EGF-like domain-containing protein n=1 Tax=Oncorhynchus tshawytscha TaxID=74940 RepID=A0A8C8MMD8_ONCTS